MFILNVLKENEHNVECCVCECAFVCVWEGEVNLYSVVVIHDVLKYCTNGEGDSKGNGN